MISPFRIFDDDFRKSIFEMEISQHQFHYLSNALIIMDIKNFIMVNHPLKK